MIYIWSLSLSPSSSLSHRWTVSALPATLLGENDRLMKSHGRHIRTRLPGAARLRGPTQSSYVSPWAWSNLSRRPSRQTSARDVQGGVAGRPPAAQRAFASELRRRRGGQPRSSGRAFSGGNPPGKQPWHGASMECAPVEVWTRGANHRRRKEK